MAKLPNKFVSMEELYIWLPTGETPKHVRAQLKKHHALNVARLATGWKPFEAPYREVSDEIYAKLEQALALLDEVQEAIEPTK